MIWAVIWALVTAVFTFIGYQAGRWVKASDWTAQNERDFRQIEYLRARLDRYGDRAALLEADRIDRGSP